jgi:hypothetical protein
MRHAECRTDKRVPAAYIGRMKALYVIVPLIALLIAALWFAGSMWAGLVGDVPLYGWFAIAGGVLFSLALGGGLMALMFYSERHGYDDNADGRPR